MRLRNQLVYYGAHTGRWAGRGVQPHNLTRKPTDPETMQALINKTPVTSLDKLSTCIRPCIRAPRGFKFIVSDLSAIENRVLAWLSGCDAMLEVYEKGLDPYKAFAVELFNCEYENVTKDQRQLSKPAVLGCGYGQGAGQIRTMSGGTKIKTGLWGYAEKMGVKITQQQSQGMVGTFRSAYAEVVYYWGYLEDAFLAAYKTRKRQQVGAIFFSATKDAVLMHLPSGRNLHYLNPHAYRTGSGLHISFDGLRMGGWGRQSLWGGVLTENVVQAVSRDVLVEGMKRAEAMGMPVVLHVHDELVSLVPEDSPLTHKDLERVMSEPISWAEGLPLAAEGYSGEFYEKH